MGHLFRDKTFVGHIVRCALGAAVITISGCAPTGHGAAKSPAGETSTKAGGPPEFDRAAAQQALDKAETQAIKCARPAGVPDSFPVATTFGTHGQTTAVTPEVELGNTPPHSEFRKCVEGAYRAAAVPEFVGGEITLRKYVKFEAN